MQTFLRETPEYRAALAEGLTPEQAMKRLQADAGGDGQPHVMLMAGGEAGVDRMIEILSEQIARTMRLLGVASLDELAPKHVTQLQRLVPRRI